MASTTWRKHAAAAVGSGGRIPAGGPRPSSRLHAVSRAIDGILTCRCITVTRAHTGSVIVDWTDEFDRWLTNAEEQGGNLPAVAVALLQALNDLPAKPDAVPASPARLGR